MNFQKKDWQFRDIISEDELNRMEDGIEEGIIKAEQAQQTADDAAIAAANAQGDIDTHKEDKNNPHNVTSDQVNLLPLNSYKYDDPASVYPHGVTAFLVTLGGEGGWPVNGEQGMVITFRASADRNSQFITDNAYGSSKILFRKFREAYGWFGEVELLHTGNTTNIVDQEYETGTWTPVLRGLNVPGNHTYSLRRGNYHIIGDRIFVNGELRIISGEFDSNMSGGIVISGLPFAQRDSANDSTAFTIGVRSGIDPAKPVYGYMGRGENVLSLLSGWTSDMVRITHEDFSTPVHISFSGHYRI